MALRATPLLRETFQLVDFPNQLVSKYNQLILAAKAAFLFTPAYLLYL